MNKLGPPLNAKVFQGSDRADDCSLAAASLFQGERNEIICLSLPGILLGGSKSCDLLRTPIVPLKNGSLSHQTNQFSAQEPNSRHTRP